MKRALLVVFFALAVAACGKQRVATQPDQPPLAPPAPPPRVVAPPDTEQEQPPPAPEPERRPVRRPPQKSETPPPRAEAPKAPPVQETPPPAKPETAPPPTTLQTTQPATQVEMEKQVRGTLAQAARDLGRVNYAALNADGKGQYDTAKRFVEQAQQAIKEQNLVQASRQADTAATIASVLVWR